MIRSHQRAKQLGRDLWLSGITPAELATFETDNQMSPLKAFYMNLGWQDCHRSLEPIPPDRDAIV